MVIMKHKTASTLLAATLVIGAALSGQQPPADLVLTNGKIITVDDRFSIAQAVAVRGERIVAVGTTADINLWLPKSQSRRCVRGRSGKAARPDYTPKTPERSRSHTCRSSRSDRVRSARSQS
jgi:hypothetical protein